MKINYSLLIKEYREKHFLSQTELGEMLGVSYVTVNRWENGHFKPTLKCKRKLNELFEKDAEREKR